VVVMMFEGKEGRGPCSALLIAVWARDYLLSQELPPNASALLGAPERGGKGWLFT